MQLLVKYLREKTIHMGRMCMLILLLEQGRVHSQSFLTFNLYKSKLLPWEHNAEEKLLLNLSNSSVSKFVRSFAKVFCKVLLHCVFRFFKPLSFQRQGSPIVNSWWCMLCCAVVCFHLCSIYANHFFFSICSI